MNFWLKDEWFVMIAPHLSNNTRDKERANDRRVVSGIVHFLKSDEGWMKALRDVYVLKKTLHNRFVRWPIMGVWVELLEILAQTGGPLAQVLINSSVVKAHRCAAERKRMVRPVSEWCRERDGQHSSTDPALEKTGA